MTHAGVRSVCICVAKTARHASITGLRRQRQFLPPCSIRILHLNSGGKIGCAHKQSSREKRGRYEKTLVQRTSLKFRVLECQGCLPHTAVLDLQILPGVCIPAFLGCGTTAGRAAAPSRQATLRRRAPQSLALTRGKEGGTARACGGGGSATVEFRQAALDREGSAQIRGLKRAQGRG